MCSCEVHCKLYTFYVKVIKTFSKYTGYLYHCIVWYCISVFTLVINIFTFQHPYINPPSFISCNSEGVITVRNFLPNGTLRDCLCKVIYYFLIINIPFLLKQYTKIRRKQLRFTKSKFCWFFFSITLNTQFRFSYTCNMHWHIIEL